MTAEDPRVNVAAADEFAAALRAAKAGDDAGFTTVFRAMQPSVLRYLTVVAGRQAAEDLAAETWVAALRGLTNFVGDERAFRAWLITIARARWVDNVRAKTRRPEHLVDAVPEQASADDVERAVERGLSTDEALALIATLPADQAEVISLRVVADLDVGEVAELLGKTANHVRVLSHRGLRRLADLVTASAGQAR